MSRLSRNEKDRIIREFQSDFDLAHTAEAENRRDMLDDLRFAALDQWPEEVKTKRKGKPMLTLDRTGQPIRKILGDMRQNVPSIKIHPSDSGSDPETAKVLEGLVRQIEYVSKARRIYLRAAKTQVKCGYGVIRVNTRFTSDEVFEQEISILPVRNPFTCYFDPDAILDTKADGRFCIVSESIDAKQFSKQYGKRVPAGNNQGTGESNERWYSADSVRVAEYFQKKKVKRTLVLLSDGSTVSGDDLTDEQINLYAAQNITPVRDRVADVDEITYNKLTGFEVLERRTWMGRYFPLVPVYGPDDNIEGKTEYKGVVRPAKDPQRMYNYWNTAAAETIALQPKAPYKLTPDQLKGLEAYWRNANTENYPYLLYNPDPQAPPPQREAPPLPQAGLLQQASFAAQDVREATGVFEPSVGSESKVKSGKAILAEQSAADTGTNEYIDNLECAVEQVGNIIVDLIPHIYDTQRTVAIRGEDDSEEFVAINQPMITPDGFRIKNDLTRGKYDVRISTGPSYRTRRIEAASSMVELGRVFPQVMQVAGDLVAKNLDWPGAEEIAERLRKLLPPGIAEPREDDEPPTQEQQVAQQMQIQAAELEMEAKETEIQEKQAKIAKTLSDKEREEVETAMKMAEFAQGQGQQEMMALALQQALDLMTVGQPVQQQPQQVVPPTVGFSAG